MRARVNEAETESSENVSNPTLTFNQQKRARVPSPCFPLLPSLLSRLKSATKVCDLANLTWYGSENGLPVHASKNRWHCARLPPRHGGINGFLNIQGTSGNVIPRLYSPVHVVKDPKAAGRSDLLAVRTGGGSILAESRDLKALEEQLRLNPFCSAVDPNEPQSRCALSHSWMEGRGSTEDGRVRCWPVEGSVRDRSVSFDHSKI